MTEDRIVLRTILSAGVLAVLVLVGAGTAAGVDMRIAGAAA